MQQDTAANDDPIEMVRELLEQARAARNAWPEAMSLATADARGRPSNRMVLLRGCDARGFAFYTNGESRKGGELAVRAHAALCFWWPELEVQVRIEGEVERVESEEADRYFASRPRGHQLGAWASQQSQPLASRDELEQRVRELEARYAAGEVPRPPHWGGYRVRPLRIEIWRQRPDRLHEREVFERQATEARGWERLMLQP